MNVSLIIVIDFYENLCQNESSFAIKNQIKTVIMCINCNLGFYHPRIAKKVICLKFYCVFQYKAFKWASKGVY